MGFGVLDLEKLAGNCNPGPLAFSFMGMTQAMLTVVLCFPQTQEASFPPEATVFLSQTG
jgi:hypothetical protein